MKLVHYSHKPLTKVRSIPRKQRGARGGGAIGDKPKGFWVSDDDCEQNWFAWCQSESFDLDRQKYRQEIVLKEDANILLITSVDQLGDFSTTYGASLCDDDEEPVFGAHRSAYWRLKINKGWIRWDKVCQKHDGIIITPYLWDHRLDGPIFYYGWDCASGAIWDAKVIDRIGPAEKL